MTAVEREADRGRLVGFLVDLRAGGRRVPCLDLPDAAPLFVSDDEDEQRFAARLCVGCAGATDCGAYGLRWPKEHGVYGGATTAERQPQIGRPRKPKTATTKAKETAA